MEGPSSALTSRKRSTPLALVQWFFWSQQTQAGLGDVEMGESDWHLFSVLGHAETVSPNASSPETGGHTLADIV